MAVMEELRYEIEQYLYHEARLIDERRLDEWVELFTDDCLYWLPNLGADTDPTQVAPLIHDNKYQLKLRAVRLQHPSAHTQRPVPRTLHFIGNVVILGNGDGDYEVRSNQLVHWVRGGIEVSFPAACEHVLRREGNSWRIRKKKVALVTNQESLSQIPVL